MPEGAENMEVRMTMRQFEYMKSRSQDWGKVRGMLLRACHPDGEAKMTEELKKYMEEMYDPTLL